MTAADAGALAGFLAPGDALPRPHGNCYWLWPGRILAGEHPFANRAPLQAAPLERLLAAGVRATIDLTEASEGLARYDALWDERRALHGDGPPCAHVPIPDYGLPSPEALAEVLARLQAHLRDGPPVYLHCHGGAGRTGTVAACLMVEAGLAPEQALARLAAKWQVMDKRGRIPHSPETEAQRQFVLERRPPPLPTTISSP